MIDPSKAAPTLASALFSPNQEAPKLGQSTQPLSFSLDDITGDVDHIQTSLDNIRDLMFESLPDGTTLEDLFGEDSEFLSPLLHAVETPAAEQKLAAMSKWDGAAADLFETFFPSDNHQTNPATQQVLVSPAVSATAPSQVHQPVQLVNNQLLQQLIHEKVTVEEQRHHIDELERAQSDLKDKIHQLEQQQAHERHQQ